MQLLIHALSHLLVDAVCAAALFGGIGEGEGLARLIALYSTLAFSTQCLVGLAADRVRNQRIAVAASMVCVALGFALPLSGLFRVILYRRKERLRRDAAVALYGDRIVLDEGTAQEMTLPFEELSTVAVLGKNKLNLYHGEELYQLKGDKHFNALKFVHIFNRSKNIARGDFDDQFLGL